MVSADNLNYDVLILIFAFLGPNDLVSVCLVSKSFRASALPWLYRKIQFRLSHMKRWPLMQSPFTTILEHPHLALHVRSCDIRSVPRLKDRPHPRFIAASVESLSCCRNLVSFTCMVPIPPFLSLLPTKTRLSDLKLNAAVLNTDQSLELMKVDQLQSLSLYEASLNICQALPKWIPTMNETLDSITITNSRDLNQDVLKTIIPPSSRLRGLHIIGCSKITGQGILQLLSRTPRLESLSSTIWEQSSATSEITVSLPSLKHISFDIRCSIDSPPDVVPLPLAVLAPFFTCPVKSITMKFAEETYLPDTFIFILCVKFSDTLVRFNTPNAGMGVDSMDSLCRECLELEQVAVMFPEREDMVGFIDAISSSLSLETLIDLGDAHSGHGKRSPLKKSDVWELFQLSQSLKKIISGNRCWTCERTYLGEDDDEEWEDEDYVRDPNDYHIEVKLERVKHVNNVAYSLMEPRY